MAISKIGGLTVIENPMLTVPGEPQEVRRTWRERLFTKPWRPRQATKTIVPQVPDQKIYYISKDRAIMHPEVAKRVRDLTKG